jgi:nonsense-mediated mRNA decay protein 3
MDCFLNGRKLLNMAHHVDLERCTSCHDFHLGGQWLSMGVSEAVEEAAISGITVIPEAKVVEVAARARQQDDRNYIGDVEVGLDIDGHQETVLDSTTVRVKNTVCHRCSRQLGNYYESILQLRSAEKEIEITLRDEVLNSIVTKVDNISKNSRQIFITKVEEIHGGLDFYLSSISLGKSLSKDLVTEYGAELKESSTLVGRKSDGSDMYRVTYLVRMPVYKIHDVVLYADVPQQVLTMGKNGVKLLNLRDFHIHSVKPAEMRSLKVIRTRDDVKEAVVVNPDEDEAQVLHPGNFRTVDIRLPPNYMVGETAKVIDYEGELFFIP